MYIYIWNSHVVKNWFVFVRQAAGECVRAVCENCVRKLAGAYDFANDSRHGMCFFGFVLQHS